MSGSNMAEERTWGSKADPGGPTPRAASGGGRRPGLRHTGRRGRHRRGHADPSGITYGRAGAAGCHPHRRGAGNPER